jgi:hypothetical protein
MIRFFSDDSDPRYYAALWHCRVSLSGRWPTLTGRLMECTLALWESLLHSGYPLWYCNIY